MTDTSGTPQRSAGGSRRHSAGLFDVRTIIGSLLAIYGVILLVVGLVGGSATSTATTAGDSTNVWVGVALLVVGLFFLGWTWLRPTVVDEAEPERETAGEEPEETAAREDGSTLAP